MSLQKHVDILVVTLFYFIVLANNISFYAYLENRFFSENLNRVVLDFNHVSERLLHA